MAQKIDAAINHGGDIFIFDWYMYEEGPFLNRCLDEGFLKAAKFNHVDYLWNENNPFHSY